MLTIQDVVRTAGAQRRFPNWILWTLGTVLTVWAIGSMAGAFPWQGSGNVSAPAQVEQSVAVPAVSNPQVPQNVQENAAVVPRIPLVEVRWGSIGRTGRGYTKTVLDLPIPERAQDSMGDGVATMSRDPTDGRYWFTPDKGVHKYKLANEPPAQFAPGFGGEGDIGTHGAFLQEGAVVLFMYTQVEPWVYEHWRAEILPSELEGLSR